MLKVTGKAESHTELDDVQKASLLRRLRSDDPKISIIRDILLIVIIIAVTGGVLFGVSGTWPAIVAVESESMVPNMNVGDLIFVVEKNRFGPVMTASEARETGVKSFNGFGDVIIYQPNGNAKVTPIIHRAIREINASVAKTRGFASDAAYSGYITKGDNNLDVDQGNTFQGYTFSGIGVIQPVKEEWIVGKALFAIPLVGYLPLHIREFAVVIVILLIVWEIYSREKEKNRETRETDRGPLKKDGRK
ncbi:MAG TPA: signal peptidase I [Methanocorpusculum sp.]|nr:signal peptidase I [Methanocorpusculum sp.]